MSAGSLARLSSNGIRGSASSDRVGTLDGIRGIALLLVLACHTHPQLFRGGYFGVDLFFVLSGFLITSILLGEARRRGTINIGRFYLRRALRLLPALLVMVGAVMVYTTIFQPEKLDLALKDAKYIIFYAFNWLLAGDYLHIVERHQIMFSHLWSLSVEEQFYMVWPCLVLALIYFKVANRTIALLLAVGIVAPAVARYLVWQEGPSLWIYFRTELRFDNLMWGALVAWALDWGMLPKDRMGRLILSWLGTAGLVCLLGLASFNLIPDGSVYRGVFSLVGLAAALLIAAAVWCPSPPLRWLLSLGALRWVGRISYGLYLWHLPVLLVCAEIPDPLLRNVGALAGTFAVASLSYYGFELWFLRLKDHIGHAPVAPATITLPAHTPQPGEALVKVRVRA